MKFAAALLILGFVAAAALADDTPKPAEENPCANVGEERNVKSKLSGEGFFGAWHCMTYTHCKDKVAVTKHCFGWPILPISQYSPQDKECKWFWQKHDCKANDA